MNDAAQTGSSPSVPGISEAPMLRILMLEDTPTDAELAQHELRKAGLAFTAQLVDTRDAFVRALHDFRPDIVLSDFSLPNFGGLEALEIVRQTYPEVPVIMVTGALPDTDAVELIHAGARDYVLKDRLARLVPAIQRVLSMERGSRARKAAEDSLRMSEALLKQTQQIAKVGGWEYDVANKKIYWTDEVYQIYEVDPRDYDPNDINQSMKFHAPGDQAIIDRAFQRAVEWGEPYTLELQLVGARGMHKWIRTAAQAELISGKVARVFGSILDITESKQAEEKMLYLAHYDDLTNLPNRTLFRDRMAQEIKKAQRASLPLALLYIDIDNFKEVNDTLGHDMGDLLLVEAARRIGECVRVIDTVARMGGDEFTVILSELDDTGSIERVARNIIQKLAEPFHLKNEIAHVSASIGITLYPDDGADVEELLKNADQAMYAAKSRGRNRYGYFTHAMQEAAQARLRLINDLRDALAYNQFRVYFQPIVDMATGHVQKAEALIRWQHPVRGMVSPADFIPLAEETGLILEIGDWVFQESARWVKRWRESHHTEFQVSVNKSPVQFYKHGDEHSAWLTHLRSLGLPGQSIVIEITEGLLLGAEPAITGALLTYRSEGIQIAIDDFGTGYSSLSYLNRFHIDYLKIDQSFTRNLAPGSGDMALSEAIIVMAHKLGMMVIAEGVETEAQRELLAAAGCDYAQGYLYSKAVPPEEFEALLKNWKTQSSPQ